MKKLILLIFIMPFCIQATCQINPQWADTIAMDTSYTIWYGDGVIDNVGNVYTTGSKFNSSGNTSLILVKYNPSGIRQFLIDTVINQIGTTELAVDDSLNIYLTTNLFSATTWNDVLLIKYNAGGQLLWSQTYSSGSLHSEDRPHKIALHDGYIYITGTSDSSGSSGDRDFITLKYNASGNLQWAARYHYFVHSEGYGIGFDSNHNVYVAGFSLDPVSNGDIALIKYNPAGVQQWAKRYTNNNDFVSAVTMKVAPDGNCFIAGVCAPASSQGSNDYLCLRYDSSGNFKWASIFDAGFGSGGSDEISDMAIDDSENVYLTGTQFINSSPDQNYFTMKYDSSGNNKWYSIFNGGVYGDEAYSICMDSSQNIYVTGASTDISMNREIKTVKYDTNGNLLWTASYNAGVGCGSYPYENKCDASGTLYISGYFVQYPVAFGFETLKYGNTVGIENNDKELTAIHVFPNPFNAGISIIIQKENLHNATINVKDILGQSVFMKQENIFFNNHTETFDLSFLSKGIYFLDMVIDGERMVRKIVKQ